MERWVVRVSAVLLVVLMVLLVMELWAVRAQ